MKQHKSTIIAVSILAIILAGVWWFGGAGDNSSATAGPGWGEVTYQSATSSATSSSAGTSARAQTADWSTYTHRTHNFRFKYPPEFTVGEVPHGSGQTVVVQNAGKRQGFQIYIEDIGENITFTKERIKQDIPDITVENPQPVQIGESGRGIAFLSQNEKFGRSREVWFTHQGVLYQISTYASLDSLMQEVLGTWEFR